LNIKTSDAGFLRGKVLRENQEILMRLVNESKYIVTYIFDEAGVVQRFLSSLRFRNLTAEVLLARLGYFLLQILDDLQVLFQLRFQIADLAGEGKFLLRRLTSTREHSVQPFTGKELTQRIS
jgi:hypothetical protein